MRWVGSRWFWFTFGSAVTRTLPFSSHGFVYTHAFTVLVWLVLRGRCRTAFTVTHAFYARYVRTRCPAVAFGYAGWVLPHGRLVVAHYADYAAPRYVWLRSCQLILRVYRTIPLTHPVTVAVPHVTVTPLVAYGYPWFGRRSCAVLTHGWFCYLDARHDVTVGLL